MKDKRIENWNHLLRCYPMHMKTELDQTAHRKKVAQRNIKNTCYLQLKNGKCNMQFVDKKNGNTRT